MLNQIKSFIKISRFLFLLAITIIIFSLPFQVLGVDNMKGKELFTQNCSGCHLKGGNIIRRGKTLKLSALERNGISNPEAIAKIARNGVGIMSGYKEVLGEGGDKLVAEWIWEQAQNAWIQG